METNFDVVIIGGGPGGSSAATYLSKLGYKVILFEKEKFPRDHVGESLIPYCYYKLKDMGVLDDVLKFSTKKPGVNFVNRDATRQSIWCFDKVIEDGGKISMHTLRAPFDKALLDHSKKCGATIFEECLVKDVDLSDPQKVTVRVADKSGIETKYSARFLVDASGQNSFLAKKLGGKTSYNGLDRVALFSHWIDTSYDMPLKSGLIKIIYLGGKKKGWIWVIPVGRNHLSVGVTLNNSYVKEQKKKFTGPDWVEKLYLQEVKESNSLQQILKDGRLEHKVQMLGDYSYYVKNKFGSNYAMVGDSAAFLDPIFSSGIYVAMEVADRVSKSIDIKFREGDAAAHAAFSKHFEDVDGGYALIEKFVRLFYDPELLNFSEAGPDDDGYSKFLNAYEIFHYLLAGDFFGDYKKYSDFIDDLQRERNFNRFIHYVKTKANEFTNEDFCKYSYEEVYGHLPEGNTVAPGLLSIEK